MRLKAGLALVLSVGTVATVVVFITRPPSVALTSENETVPAASLPAPETTVPNTGKPAITTMANSGSALPTPVPAKIETDEERQSRIEAEIEHLLDWSMNHDGASFSNIVVRLTSPEKEVRAAAIEAARQFGSTNAIPALKAAADATDDLREKIECLEAAEFLTLPPLPFSHPPAGLQEEMEARALARQKGLNPPGEPAPNLPPQRPTSDQ